MKEKILLDFVEIDEFKNINYERKNIENFIEELKKLKYKVVSNCEDKTYGIFAGNYQVKLLAIYGILMSKKIEKNKEDFKKLGQYVQELGKKIENYEETMKNYENQEKLSNYEEKMKDFFKSIIDDIFEEN